MIAGVADPASTSGEKASMQVTGSIQVLTAPRAVRRYESGGYTDVTDNVLKEWTLRIHINSVLFAELICTPDNVEELVLGFLYSGGVISSGEDVESLELSHRDANVTLRANATGRSKARRYEAGSVVEQGDFVGVSAGLDDICPDIVLTRICWDPQAVLANATMLLNRSRLFKKTGNVHSVAICRGPDLLYFHEDVGRFNAFDKCVGHALKDGVDLSDTCVYTTGRIPSSIVAKTIRAGIPMIVSRSAPTQAALALADTSGLTVVGFARGDRFNLYLPAE